MKKLLPILFLICLSIPSSSGYSWGPVMMSGGVASVAPPAGISRIGEYTQFNNPDNTSSQASITVPADAEIMIVCAAGWNNQGQIYSHITHSLTIDGHAMTVIGGGDTSTSYFCGGMFWADVTGHRGASKTLAWDFGVDDMADGGVFAYGFYKGVNLTTPTADKEGSQDAGNPYATKTLTATTYDLIVAWGFCFTSAGNMGFAWTNATEVFAVTGYDNSDGSVAEKAATGNVSITADESVADTAQDGGIYALVLKPAI